MSSFEPTSIRALRPEDAFSLDGKVAVITGAGGGIGRWLAAGLGVAGARVLLTDNATEPMAEVERTLAAAGVEAASLDVDLVEEDAPERIVAGTLDRFSRLDVLVNCAAVNRRMPILEMDRDTYDLIMRLNLRVPYFLSRAAAPVMRDGSGGSIVNISSLNAAYALEQISVYGPAKAGLSQLTRVMALEWAAYGIRANAIAPGFMDTPLAEPIWADPERRRWILNRVPLRRPGLPSELVGTCLLLASDAGAFLTGQTLYVDGGALAGGRWFTPDE